MAQSTLSTRHQELAIQFELHYLRHGKLPTASDLPIPNLTQKELDHFLSQPTIIDYLVKERSIPLAESPKLTAKQLDWINSITDPSDQRPLTKKLEELNLKMAEVRRWNANPYYAKILYERTNKAFGNNRHAVLRSLQLEAMAGNISAIKLYLEMTGDVEAQSHNVNVTNNTVSVEARSLLSSILEILQRHLQPELLSIIVDELEAATVGRPAHLPALPEPPLSQRTAQALEVRSRPYVPPSIKQVVQDSSDWTS